MACAHCGEDLTYQERVVATFPGDAGRVAVHVIVGTCDERDAERRYHEACYAEAARGDSALPPAPR